eukprot:8775775-Pyramimonas_sp.AAC.1
MRSVCTPGLQRFAPFGEYRNSSTGEWAAGRSPVGSATECSPAPPAIFGAHHASDSALSFSPPAGEAGGVYRPARPLSLC